MNKEFIREIAPSMNISANTNENNIQIIDGLLKETDPNTDVYKDLQNQKTGLLFRRYAEKLDTPGNEKAVEYLKKSADKIISGKK